jgi:hypothetical protein
VSEFLSLTRPNQSVPLLDPGLSELAGNQLLATLPPGDFQLLAPYLHKARFEPGHACKSLSRR